MFLILKKNSVSIIKLYKINVKVNQKVMINHQITFILVPSEKLPLLPYLLIFYKYPNDATFSENRTLILILQQKID